MTRTLHGSDYAARDEKTLRSGKIAHLRFGWRHTPIVIARGKLPHNVAVANDAPIEIHILKFFISRNLQPVLVDALLSVPTERYRESNFTRRCLLGQRYEGKTRRQQDRGQDEDQSQVSQQSEICFCGAN